MAQSTTTQLPFFVYGTLLPGQPNFALWAEAVFRTRPATYLNAALYDVGAYPMLVEGETGLVQGLVIDVRPEHYGVVLAAVDQLEAFDPDSDEPSAFRRAQRHVLLAEGTIVQTWVYLADPAYAAGQPRIRSGDWQTHTESRQQELEALWQELRRPDRQQ